MEATFGPVVYMEYVEGVGMKEIYGDLWNAASDLRVISTNGIVRKDGACVMGRGCAYEAKTRFPGIEFRLGELLQEHGNRVLRLGRYGGTMISSFPVKHHWKQEADPILIRRSAKQLVKIADKFGHERVIIPRPGCGNGKLRWSDVRPILAEVLDDRFAVITFPPKGGNEQRAEADKQPQRPKETQTTIEGPCQIELRCYDSPDSLGLGRYRSHVLEGVYDNQELAEAEISIQEPLVQATEAIAIMVPVPAVSYNRAGKQRGR
jgi:hypothetical protein